MLNSSSHLSETLSFTEWKANVLLAKNKKKARAEVIGSTRPAGQTEPFQAGGSALVFSLWTSGEEKPGGPTTGTIRSTRP